MNYCCKVKYSIIIFYDCLLILRNVYFIVFKLVWNVRLIKYKIEWLNIMVNNDDVGYFKG